MEDSFKVRVDKVFGNLGSDTPFSAGVSPSLWSLTDDEIEKREWNRHKEVAEDGEEKSPESGPSFTMNRVDSDLKELSDVEEEEEEEDEEEEEEEKEEEEGNEVVADEIDEEKRRRPNSSAGAEAGVDEYLDVQSNIGRDCTLDYEEEEDEYDKVAVGMEQIGDRLYMKNVKYADYSVDEANGYGELPETFQDVVRDPRANHLAAKNRLKEDAEAAGDFDTLQLSDNSMAMNPETDDHKKLDLVVDNPKPILKKGDNPESRSQKRVRFMFGPENNSHTLEEQQSSGASDDSALTELSSDHSQYSAGVPDYLINPSKYTRYTFDSSDDVDEESNRKAYMDFFQFLRKRNSDTSMEDTSVDTPKSVVFTPKKKQEHNSMAKRSESEHNTKKSWSVGITAEESEVSAMDEDEAGSSVDEGAHSSRKLGRRYRIRTNINTDDKLD